MRFSPSNQLLLPATLLSLDVAWGRGYSVHRLGCQCGCLLLQRSPLFRGGLLRGRYPPLTYAL